MLAISTRTTQRLRAVLVQAYNTMQTEGKFPVSRLRLEIVGAYPELFRVVYIFMCSFAVVAYGRDTA